jgi:hypothetical protein
MRSLLPHLKVPKVEREPGKEVSVAKMDTGTTNLTRHLMAVSAVPFERSYKLRGPIGSFSLICPPLRR